MSFFKKIGNFFKKALPVVGGLAGSLIPGVGPAIGKIFNGFSDAPVELKGDGSEGGSGWWSGIGNAVGGLLNSDFVSNYGPGLLQGGLSYAGGRETNAEAAHQAQLNRDFQAQQAQQQMDFQRSSVERQADLSNWMAQKSMDFSASQAELNRAFQERMANTAQQRGAADMAAAGFNPMLSFMKGGADVPSGNVAQGAQGTASMGSGASGHGSQAPVVNALGGAVSSAMQGAKMQGELDYMRAQTSESYARALESATRLPKIQAETVVQQVSAEKQHQEIENLRYQILKMEDEMLNIRARTQGQRLDNEQKAYYNLFMIQLDRQVKEYQARLMGLGIPRAKNEAEFQEGWFAKTISPYLPDVLKGTSSAAQFGRAFSH